MKTKYEHKSELKFIGFSTQIHPEEGYLKCPEFWNEVYYKKYARLWQTMQPQNEVEQAILVNGIGMYALCINHQEKHFDYWIAGIYQGGAVPDGFKTINIPESDWAIFTEKGPIPQTLQRVNDKITKEWLPSEGQKRNADPRIMIEAYSAGDPNADDYEFSIWVPIN